MRARKPNTKYRVTKSPPQASSQQLTASSPSIPPHPCIPSHLHRFGAHADSISERMNGRALIVSPGDRDFHDFEFVPEGYVNDLRVKSPAMDALQRKNYGGGAAGEGLESALGIAERKTHQQFDVQVERARKKPAAQRLAHKLQ